MKSGKASRRVLGLLAAVAMSVGLITATAAPASAGYNQQVSVYTYYHPTFTYACLSGTNDMGLTKNHCFAGTYWQFPQKKIDIRDWWWRGWLTINIYDSNWNRLSGASCDVLTWDWDQWQWCEVE